MALFGRQVWVEVGTRKLEGLRVSFRAHLDRSGTPNTASIEVYNCAPGTILLAQDPASVVRLVAGYDTPRAIFVGNPTKHGVVVTKQGPDRILKLELQDGGHQLATARIDIGYQTEVSVSQILDTLIAKLGLPRGVIQVSDDKRFPHGVTLRGPVREVLDRIAVMSAQGKAGWFVRDGALYLLPHNAGTAEQAIEVSVDRGNLIGSPGPKDEGIEVTTLLDPGIRPGRTVVVKSERVDGTYGARGRLRR